MDPVAPEIYRQIDNGVYDREGEKWWEPTTALYLLKTSVNPARVGYFRKVLFERLKIDPRGMTALEVGCGGGILTEEIARMGFETTGIDPSEASLHTAENHSRAGGLSIRYELGSGERIPFPDRSYDAVFCCDVLEHVENLPAVIAEIGRVLRPGGVFCYDTLNRTFFSKLVAIKLWQEWKRFAIMPPNLHVWEMFIKPSEMTDLLNRSGFAPAEQRGTSPSAGMFTMLRNFRKRAKGEWNYKELGESFQLRESGDKSILYMGYALRT